MKIEKLRKVICALIGHSKIQSTFFGYFYCGRCRDQVGDNLGSVYDAKDIVVIDHNCEQCRENYIKLTWRDKFMVPNPFKET